MVGTVGGVLAVFFDHLVLRLLLRLHILFLRFLLLLICLSRCAGVGFRARDRRRCVRQQEGGTQNRENKDYANSLHRFGWNLEYFTTACNWLFHYASKWIDHSPLGLRHLGNAAT